MMEEGTTTRTSLQIEAELDRLGSHLATGGSREWSAVSLDSLKRHLPASLELMTDVLLHPSFPGEELDRLRKQRLDAMLQEQVSPGAIAASLCANVFSAESILTAGLSSEAVIPSPTCSAPSSSSSI